MVIVIAVAVIVVVEHIGCISERIMSIRKGGRR